MSALTGMRPTERSAEPTPVPPGPSTWRSRAGEDPVRTYFVLAFAYSWACWLPAIALDGALRDGLVFLGVWGPAAAGATATRLGGGEIREWLRGILVWRVPGRWYAFALAVPVGMIAAVSIPFVLLGHDLDSSLLGTRLASYLPMLVFLGLVGGGNEELGWRGFALPGLLERHSPVRATLVLGSLWAVWHVPLLGAADDLTHGLAAAELTFVLLATLVNIVGLSFIYTFLFRHTRSALLAVVLHGSFNTANGVLVLREEIEGPAYAAMQYCITVMTVAVAAVLCMRTRGRLGPDHATSPVASRPSGGSGVVSIADPSSSGSRKGSGSSSWWHAHRTGLGVAVGLSGAWGLVAGLWTPRGPATSGTALASIAVSLLVGVGAGTAMRSRWAMGFAPAAFVGVFEIVRLDVAGPMVDGIRMSEYGLIAFVTGRGFHGLLALVPMLLGAAIGAGWARRRLPDAAPHGRRIVRALRRGVAGLTAVGLVLLAVGLARPATTAPIVDADGNEIPGSIAELTAVEIDGHDLGLLIRGHREDNPVLLFLAGGPGGSEYGAMRRHLEALEEHFTVVTWDQRGAGTSYPELDPVDTITLDGYVDDTIAVSDYLRERFGQDRIYLVGQSWGTTLGVLAAQRRPELYRAFVGTGQMVSQRATDVIFYEDTLDWARSQGRDGLVDELERIGPPPYDSMFPYETALSHEQDVYPYDHGPNAEGSGQMSENLFVEEYTLIDQLHVIGAFMDTFAALYPQLQRIDFRATATEFEIPVFFVQGAHEAEGRSQPFEEWYPMIDAPVKDLAVLETSGHRPLWEQPEEFVDYMVGTVLAETSRP